VQRRKNGVTLYNAGLIIFAIFLGIMVAGNRKEQVNKRKEELLRELSQAKSIMSAQPAEGLHWEQVAGDGFGDPKNGGISSSAVFKDYLYVGTMNARPGTNGGEVTLHSDGAEVWRTINGTDWEPVTTNGNLGGLQNRYGNTYMWSMAVFDDHLLIGTLNPLTGCEIWASESGAPDSFKQVNISGMESGRDKVEIVHNDETYYLNEQYGARTFAIFQDKLYVGTATWALHLDLISIVFGLTNYWHSSRVGCEVWRIDRLLSLSPQPTVIPSTE
jgi:hypothetical protein